MLPSTTAADGPAEMIWPAILACAPAPMDVVPTTIPPSGALIIDWAAIGAGVVGGLGGRA